MIPNVHTNKLQYYAIIVTCLLFYKYFKYYSLSFYKKKVNQSIMKLLINKLLYSKQWDYKLALILNYNFGNSKIISLLKFLNCKH